MNAIRTLRLSFLGTAAAGALCFSAPSWPAPVNSTLGATGAPASPLLDARDRMAVQPTSAPGATGQDAMRSLSQGRWVSACATATAVLARQVPDVQALGVFALCAAVTGDGSAAATARERLREAEPSPYFGPLTQGVLELLGKQPLKAQASWRPLLQARSDDPLVLYFEGEALHARQQPEQALAAFRGVLQRWPDFAPALAAVARLSTGPGTSPEALQPALAMAERATQIEPGNRGYWRLLADLCRQSGQTGRADAIALQHLRPPSLPALR